MRYERHFKYDPEVGEYVNVENPQADRELDFVCSYGPTTWFDIRADEREFSLVVSNDALHGYKLCRMQPETEIEDQAWFIEGRGDRTGFYAGLDRWFSQIARENPGKTLYLTLEA